MGLHYAPRQQRRRGRRAAPGFTLIELLVTITLLAVMATMAWRGIDGILRAREVNEARLDAVLRLGTVMAQWEADLAAVHDTQHVPALQFNGSTLRLTRRDEDGVRLVVWTLRDGGWQRWSSEAVTRAPALQDVWMRSQQLIGGEPGTLVALPGVAGWQVFFWRNNAWSNPQSSGDVDDSAGAGTRELLPEGVRLELLLAPPSGLSGSVTRDVVLRNRQMIQ
ncbi:prepilin-type N-terminal cleavage/methylation domain-containing protein [Caldimonas tepidiphila]|uniref:prepilin-type N-terminal cleavage/methylation domain-containing protein n=1 Tax=Caldimonas tepidiphila TaxID=2315841 RepID=UPI000E5ACE1C|nr:prepilin-type N-terminal cleavage/methylation domain-containing protein [Caldimonas tepidiphila]